MNKFYNLLEWLDITQAIDFLSHLTGTTVSKGQLMVLCRGGHCDAYLDSPPPDGKSILPETGAFCTTIPGLGHHLIKWPHPHVWKTGEIIQFCVQGDVTQFDFFEGETLLDASERFGSRQIKDGIWFVDLKESDFEPRFKRAAIHLLGSKMNGEERQPAADGSQLASSENTQRQHSSTEFRPAYSDEHVARSVRTMGIGNECPVAEEVYRQLDYLTADQALDWMSRISGHQVARDTLWALVGFDICEAYMDCRATKGFTNASRGEHEHRKVYGLGICQIMNAVKVEGAPLYLTGPAIHVDIYGYQEIELACSWWINNLENYDILFRPSDIEKVGGIVNERGGWSSANQIVDLNPNLYTGLAPDHGGAELAQRLKKLKISIDNESGERLRYCVRFENDQILAELGSDFQPLHVNATQMPLYGVSQNGAVASYTINDAQTYESEIARLRELVAEQSALLETLQNGIGPNIDEGTTEITFPYSTKELEAMKAVATEHWAGLYPNHRQPKQAAIQKAIREKLGINLLSDGAMPNKAIYLATAIRPDGAPRA